MKRLAKSGPLDVQPNTKARLHTVRDPIALAYAGAIPSPGLRRLRLPGAPRRHKSIGVGERQPFSRVEVSARSTRGRGVNVTGDKSDSQRERENTCAAAGLDAGLPAESLA
jgi:hypothetical protein